MHVKTCKDAKKQKVSKRVSSRVALGMALLWPPWIVEQEMMAALFQSRKRL